MSIWKRANDKAEQIIREEIDEPRKKQAAGVQAEAERITREAAKRGDGR
jgi:hypothetical protein